MTDRANAAQLEHWNQVAGPKWVGLGEAFEARLDAINDLLLARAAAAPGERVLDVGCGTGPTTLKLARAVGAGGTVVGIDISVPMLDVARARVAASGAAQVSLLQADAQTEALPTGFDLIVSRFGVMFFEDPAAAFANLARAARPGGRLCFVCWAPLADNPHWQVPFDIVARHVGPPAPKPPRAPGPLAFSDPAYVRAILETAGFARVAIAPEAVDILGMSPEREAAVACIMGPSGALLDEHHADAATRQGVEAEIARALAGFAAGGAMRLPATVLVVTGRGAGVE